jgi:carnitine O-acetyltransferase
VHPQAREALVAASPVNAKTLERIESAMVVVCLDDTRPITREDASWQTWVGDGRNRFYDKHQCKQARLVSMARADRTGRSDRVRERQVRLPRRAFVHGWWAALLLSARRPCFDIRSSGTPTLRMNEFMLASLAAGKVELGLARVARTGADLPEPTALPFELDAASKENVSAAEKRFDALVAQHDMQVRTQSLNCDRAI